MYINIDFQELTKTLRWLDSTDNRQNTWQQFSPSTTDIDKLFKKYTCTEFLENFYDSEPDYNCSNEEFHMYMDYIVQQKTEDDVTGRGFYEALKATANEPVQKFSKENHTLREYKKAYNKIHKQIQEYNSKRIKFCNWVEVHAEWNWDGNQDSVDRLAKEQMLKIKSAPVHKRNRFWIHETKNEITIYYYGRDWLYVDYVWSFEKKETTCLKDYTFPDNTFNILLVIDLQKQFKDDNGKYEQCIEFIKSHTDCYILGTVFCNDDGSMYEKHLNWSECKNVQYDITDKTSEDIEYPYDKLILKNGYSLESCKNIVPMIMNINDIAKEKQHGKRKIKFHIIGCDADACIMATAFSLWDRQEEFDILTDYIYTTANNIKITDIIKIMQRNFGNCII